MPEIYKLRVSRRGPRGAIEPADQARIDAAIGTADTINARIAEATEAAGAAAISEGNAVTAAGQTAQDRTATEQDRNATATDRAQAAQDRLAVDQARRATEAMVEAASPLAHFYATIALGRAAVADDEQFGVWAGGLDGLTRATIYRRISATDQALVRVVLTQGDIDEAVSDRVPGRGRSTRRGYVAAIRAGGRVLLGWDDQGRAELQRSNERRAGPIVGGWLYAVTAGGRIVGGLLRDGVYFALSATMRGQIAGALRLRPPQVLGLTGRAVFGAHHAGDGVVRFLGDLSGAVRGYLQRDGASEVIAEAGDRIELILTTGQSTDAGDVRLGAKIATTIDLPGHALMFNGGIRAPQNGNAVAASAYAALLPAREVIAGNNGETGGAAMMRWLTRMSRDIGAADGPLIYRCNGVNGFSITALLRGAAPYANGVLAAKSAQEIATHYDRGAVVRAVYLSQGHADEAMPPATYEAHLTQLALDYDADIRAATGQAEAVRVVMDPPATGSWSGHINTGYPGTLAQYRLQRDNPNFLISTPAYPFRMGDGVHYLAEYYGLRGEYRAKVHRALARGDQWKPLRPAGVTRNGAVISVTLEGGVGDLVVDTALCPAQPHLGFAYRDDAGSADIASVSVDAVGRVIAITLSAVPSGANPRIYYAYLGTGAGGAGRSGAMGNIRDSDAAPSFMGISGYPSLFNWLISFEESVS